MRKIIFKAIPALIISSGMLFAQYYDPYNYQNDYNYQNNQNNYNAYQNNNVPANNYYNNYYQEFMRTLSQEANNPNSIYYNPGFYEQYNDYNAMQGNPYQDIMNAMNWASQNYNTQPNYNGGNTAQNQYQNNYYNAYDNTAQDPYQSGYDNYNNQAYNNTVYYANPYEELMKILETESQNPNSPYYSPNANQNGYNSYDNTAQNNYYNPYDYNTQDPYQNSYYSGYNNTAQDPYQSGYYGGYDYNAQNYSQTNNMSENPYQLAAEALIKAAEELTKKANGMQDSNNVTADNQNLNNNNTSANTKNAPLYVQDFYTPFKVPQVVLDTAATKYPNVQILDVEVKEIGTYEVRMANNMRLYIDRNGNFLREKSDY